MTKLTPEKILKQLKNLQLQKKELEIQIAENKIVLEKYYLEGLAIEPNHIGINEYLGELYVATGRMELAKKRLNILKNCNCKEFEELKEIIEGKKKSKY